MRVHLLVSRRLGIILKLIFDVILSSSYAIDARERDGG